MRLRAGLIGCILTLLCPASRADEPFVPLPTAGAGSFTPPPCPTPPAEQGGGPGSVAGQIILGQQLGFRGQVSVLQRENWTFVAEGFYGLLLSRFDGDETAGGGGRVYFRRCSRDGCNSLLLGPGLNLLYQFHDGGLPVLAPSMDISWLHGFGGGGGWEIGVNFGLGVSLSDKTEGHHVTAGEVSPIISVFTGFRF